MGRRAKSNEGLDTELEDLPAPARWRVWMGRVEAVIFAASSPVSREALARVVGEGCKLENLIDDLRDELKNRPYDLIAVAGGWQLRTRASFGDAIRAASGLTQKRPELTKHEMLVLTAIGFFQPVTRKELTSLFGKEVSRDTIGALRSDGFISAGPRSPQPGAPYTYVTTPAFLEHFGFESLRDLPDMERLEEAGLLSKANLFADIEEPEPSIEDDDASPEMAFEES